MKQIFIVFILIVKKWQNNVFLLKYKSGTSFRKEKYVLRDKIQIHDWVYEDYAV